MIFLGVGGDIRLPQRLKLAAFLARSRRLRIVYVRPSVKRRDVFVWCRKPKVGRRPA